MISILSKKQAITLDKNTINSGTTESTLIDNAGYSIATYFLNKIIDPFSKKIIIITGKGNNGSDAIVTYYYLKGFGIDCQLISIDLKELNIELCNKYNIKENEILLYNKDNFPYCDWVIEGIFGIGLSRDITGIHLDVINQINGKNIISIDMPTGIYSNSGLNAGVNVQAKITLSMGNPKIGNYFNNGIIASGKIECLDIGLNKLDKNYIGLINKEDINDVLKRYDINGHKYSRGKVAILAGSIGMTGATILSSNSSYRTGAGIVKLITPKSLNNIYEQNLIEVVTCPLEDNNTGYLSIKNEKKINEILDWSNCFICGPGLLINNKSKKLIESVLKKKNINLILDAGAFAPIIKDITFMKELSKRTILTPHYSEFSNIFDISLSEITNNTIQIIKKIIPILNGRVLILKGNPTIICTSKSEIILCNEGTSILSTAGTGDVLSGILGSLLAQGYSVDDAAKIGVLLHSNAARIFINTKSNRGLMASDLINLIPESWKVLYES